MRQVITVLVILGVLFTIGTAISIQVQDKSNPNKQCYHSTEGKFYCN